MVLSVDIFSIGPRVIALWKAALNAADDAALQDFEIQHVACLDRLTLYAQHLGANRAD